MKRTLSILLATVLLLTCIPLGAVSGSAETSGDYEYTVSGGKATITKYTGSATKLTIPSKLGDYPVTTIGNLAFYNCENLKSATIPNGVTNIGSYAFGNCINLESVIIPDSVTNIGYSALYETAYYNDSANWKNNVLYIGKHLIAAQNSISGDYNIKAGTLTVAPYAFSYCEKVTSVTIPNSVVTIGAYAFVYCTGLKSVTISNKITTISEYAFSACSNLTQVVIPSSVTAIEKSAFGDCYKLTAITIPDSVKTIAYNAFVDCWGLTCVTIGSGVANIDNRTFECCESLTSITVKSNNPYFCSIDGVLFSKDKTKLWIYPEGKAGSYAVPTGVTLICDYAFNGCSNLTKVTISDSVKSIGYHTFFECYNLTSAIVGKNVTTIEKHAFAVCNKLASLTIPANVNFIGYGAFNPDFNLSDIYYTGTEAQAKTIKVAESNDNLLNATWHYNSCTGKAKHNYTNACDKSCNTCKATRKITHKYATVTKKATATTNGYTVKRCSVCKKETGKTTIYKVSSIKLSKTTYTYNGKAQNPSVVIKDSKGKTIASSNYTVTYASGRKNAGTYKVTVKMKGNYSGTKSLTFKIKPIDVSKCKISLSSTSYTYNGKVKKPSVTVKNHKGTKLSTSSYTVSYASGRKNVGTYKVTVKMKGNYTGTKTLTFKINPVKTTVKSLTAGKKSLKVAITKKTTQVSGYQIQYSTSKSFKNYKTKTLSGYKKTSTTLTGLSAKKTYYVRVRTYKMVNGKKVYSAWSTIKYKKTK